ncbi:MAG: hypothetical protein AAFW97_01180 [Pseudomonadota bacterium]
MGRKLRAVRAWVVVMAMMTCLAFSAFPALGQQPEDDPWQPTVDNPAYAEGQGPLVLVDEAHGNYHTIDGNFQAFAELLRNDGLRVQGSDQPITVELLENVDIFVIANALSGGHDAEWHLPIPSAFSAEEIAVLDQWVRDGGALLLIADHMPFPGAAADLAEAFGVIFINGFARGPDPDTRTLTFDLSSGLLADHPLIRGRNDAEGLDSVTSFTGHAFRAVTPVEVLMRMPDDWVVLLPSEAWEFEDDTPRVSARGLIQGAVLRHGSGRFAVFGEAAMFTAQSRVRDGETVRVGMNSPDAPNNRQFVLNVMRWLSGLIED